ncbi:hypothetical protein GCK72_009944 [Caenorhabditis remanei]|uniref:Uncharacterized protein n=1 Tax=Caenorhabditis remanei TaxID=31234 RepID=A0A6A5H1Y6_CAERE|nr:hypothetical protein GCK72_009944 [Caenorhabditis remanei]KAF1761688.1 hypothetical protein GCK72_009944 [Caenorhabditis remanei]
MTQTLHDKETKDDTGYYTPKNILNPAMFRLAEITRALSEVNIKIDQDKLLEDHRHPLNMKQLNNRESNHPSDIEKIETLDVENEARTSVKWLIIYSKINDKLNNEDLLLLWGSLLGRLGDLSSGSIRLLDRLDNSDSDSLSHVTNGETSEWSVVGEGLNAKWLGWDELDDSGISGLEEFGEVFDFLTGTAIDLEMGNDVSGVAIEDWSVSSGDLSWMVHDDDLGVEGAGLLGWILLGVRADGSTTNVLDGDVLDVESDVVSWHGLWERLVMHLNGLDFSGHVLWSKGDNHSWLDNSGLNTSDWNSSDSSDLVHILEWKTEWSVSWALWWDDGIKSLKEGLSGSVSFLALNSPSLEPWHVW